MKKLVVFGYKKDKPEELLKFKVWADDSVLPERPMKFYDLSPAGRQNYWDLYDQQHREMVTRALEGVKDKIDVYDYMELGSYSNYNSFAVAYSGDGSDDDVVIMSDDITDRLMEEVSHNASKYVFLLSGLDSEPKRLDIPSWESRHDATTRAEAVKYLAKAISSSFPMSPNGDKKKTMSEYAKKWNIPLDIELLVEAGNMFDQYDCASWNSSSKFC